MLPATLVNYILSFPSYQFCPTGFGWVATDICAVTDRRSVRLRHSASDVGLKARFYYVGLGSASWVLGLATVRCGRKGSSLKKNWGLLKWTPS